MIAASPGLSLAVAEILTVAMAGFAGYRRRGASVAEACAFGLLLPWMTLSLLYQVAFILRLPILAVIGESAVVLAALGILFQQRNALRRDSQSFLRFVANRPASAGILLVLLVFLTVQALVQTAAPAEREALARLLTRDSAQAAPLTSLSELSADPPPGPVLWNAAIVGLRFAAGGSGPGTNLPGFSAYLAVVFCTYALARRYAWPATAFAVSILVASMPRLVVLAVSPGLELLPAAATLFALLSLYRLVESPNAPDLCGFLVAGAFGLSQVWMSRVGALLLLPLAAIVLFRRHGIAIWWRTIRRRWFLVSAALAIALVFSQLWWLVYPRMIESGPALPDPIIYNSDGIQGAGANLLRYLVQSLHIPGPVDAFCRWAFSFEPSRLIEGLYGRLVAPLLGNAGAAAPFRIDPTLQASTVWFGPLGGFLVVPAVVFCVRRAPRRLKAVAIMLIGYFFLTALILAWTPQGARQFTLFYACSGFCTAYFLPPWYFGPRTRGLLIGFSLTLLAYGCLAIAPGPLRAVFPTLFP